MVRRFLVALLAVVAVGGVTSPAFASSGGIEGTVTLPSGATAGDVCVEVSSHWPDSSGYEASMRTAGDGRYHFDVADGTYDVQFFDCGGRDLVHVYWPGMQDPNEAKTVTVSGALVTGIDQQLAQGGEIQGHVLDENGAPITNAQIGWQTADGPEFGNGDLVYENADGSYVMHGVPVAGLRVVATRYPDYPYTWSGDTDDYKSATLVQVKAGATSTMDITLQHAGTITGHVVDEYGNAYVGACVDAYGSTADTHVGYATTDSNGDYSILVHPGAGRIAISACTSGGNTWYPHADTYDNATPIEVAPNATVTGIDVAAARQPHISGTVTDANGNPLAGAYVDLYDAIGQMSTGDYTVTKSDGTYLLPALQNKLYKVHVTPPNTRPDLVARYWPEMQTRNLATPVLASVTTDGIDVSLPVGAVINGHVTKAADGSPAAHVCVLAGGTSTQTGTDGSYHLVGVDSGSTAVQFHDCSSTPTLVSTFWQGSDARGSGQTLAVDLGQTVDGVDQTMQTGGGMHGHVVDGSGVPIAHICLSAQTTDVSSIAYGGGLTNSAGDWSATSLAPGRDYAVDAAPCDTGSPWVPVHVPGPFHVTAGGDLAIPDIVMHHGGGFSGVVTDQYGRPVDHACIYSEAEDSGGTYRNTGTDANGAYTLNGLEPGTYTAYFADCGYGFVSTYWQSPVYAPAATFTVTSDNVVTGIDQTVVAWSVPSAPTNVTTSTGDGSATISWSPPADTGHTAITGYVVNGPDGSHTLSADSRSYRFGGLSNGARYQLSVAAINAKGTGNAVTLTTALVTVHSVTIAGPSSVLAGSTAVLHGLIQLSDGSPGIARVVAVDRRRAGSTGGWTTITHVTSDSKGIWRLAVAPMRPMEYRVRIAGVTASRIQHVAAQLSAAVSGSRLVLTTSPARPGATIVVQRRRADGTWATWRRTYLDWRSRLAVAVPSGRWRAVLPAHGYWARSQSAAATVR
jgi:protocatechuate 3,4-dioxygenase beta subunit